MRRDGRTRAPSPRDRGERSSDAKRRPGEGLATFPERARAPHPDGAPHLLDLSPQAGRGKGVPDLVLLGEFGRAHGLRGEIRLKSYTEDPLAIARYGALSDGGGRSFVLASVRRAAGDQPDLLVAVVEGVASREAADALNRTRLHVARDRLAAAVAEDEFLLADLIGMSAHDAADGLVGHVAAVPNYGGGDLLEIRPAAGGATFLLPFTKAAVPVVDLAARRVVIEPPAESPDDESSDDHEP